MAERPKIRVAIRPNKLLDGRLTWFNGMPVTGALEATGPLGMKDD